METPGDTPPKEESKPEEVGWADISVTEFASGEKPTLEISKVGESQVTLNSNHTALLPQINNGIFRIRKSTYKNLDNQCPEKFMRRVKEMTMLKTHQMYQEMLVKQSPGDSEHANFDQATQFR